MPLSLRIAVHGSQSYPESGSLPRFAIPERYLSVVVHLDDSFGKAQPQTPSPLFCCVPGPKNVAPELHIYSFARIADVDCDVAVFFREIDRNPSFLVLHRVERVLDQILQHPLEKLRIDPRAKRGISGYLELDLLSGLRDAFAEIREHILDDVADAQLPKLRQRADLREPHGYLV